LEGHTNYINSLAYIEELGYLASASWDKKIRIWDVKGGKLTKTLEEHTNIIRALIYIKESGYLVSGSDDYTIKIWDIKKGKIIKT
jgi:WD40 repeat protein